MADANPFGKMVPGFDFLQNLVKSAGSALPSMGQWVAPTLDPQELEKRIDELRTVQFWLEQNAKMIGATIQALEVQRMTLSTLKTMNVQMTDLREALTIKPRESAAAPAAERRTAPPSAQTAGPAATSATTAAAASATAAAGTSAGAAATPAAGAVDPMQWWGALTKQFTELATTAMKESADMRLPGVPAPAKASAKTGAGRGTVAAGAKAAAKAAAPRAARAPRRT